MTAIIGYIERKEGNSIGVLAADNLEGLSKTKVDKLYKLSDRFVIAFVGLEVVQWAVMYTVGQLDKFNSSRVTIDSVSSLQSLLTDVLSKVFKEWKAANVVQNISEQVDIESQLVILDISDNKLYYAELGKVWEIDGRKDFSVSLEELKDGLYTFGVVVPVEKGRYLRQDYAEYEKDKIIKELDLKFNAFNESHPDTVGLLGSLEINIIGKEPNESFKSCFNSYEEVLQNLTKRYSGK